MSRKTAPRLPYARAHKRFPRLSQSVLSNFDECGLSTAFALSYHANFSSPPQARGQTFHRFAARAFEEMQAQHEDSIDPDTAHAILHEVIRQDDVDRECPTCGTDEIQPGVDKGKRTCAAGHVFTTELVNLGMPEVKDLYWVTAKWSLDNEWPIKNMAAVEHRFEANVHYPNPHGGQVERVLTGRPDVIFLSGDENEHATIIDHKDTWGMPGPKEVSEGGYFQQRFYAWLLMRNWHHVEKVTLREHYVRYDEWREASVWRERLDDIEQELAALAERFDRAYHEKAWVPSPGKWCQNCTRPTACPIPAAVRGAGRITTAPEAEEVAGQLVVAEAIVKRLKGELRAFADSHGDIPVKAAKGRRAFGYRPTTSVQRPSREEMERALMAARSGQRLDLDELYKVVHGTRFGPYSPTAETDAAKQLEDVAWFERLEAALAHAKSH